MPRELRWARDGPSQRAPETPLQRGNFSPKRKTGCPGQDLWLLCVVWQSDSPEGAKQEASAHAEAAQNTTPGSIADRVRSYAKYPAGHALSPALSLKGEGAVRRATGAFPFRSGERLVRGGRVLHGRTQLLFSACSGFFSLPGMNGLQGCARSGSGVFQTTSNWPSSWISPIITGLCRWWLLLSMTSV